MSQKSFIQQKLHLRFDGWSPVVVIEYTLSFLIQFPIPMWHITAQKRFQRQQHPIRWRWMHLLAYYHHHHSIDGASMLKWNEMLHYSLANIVGGPMYVPPICDCRWRVHPSPPSTSAYRTEIEANTGIGIEMGIDWQPFISRVLRNSMFKVRAQVCLYFIGLVHENADGRPDQARPR